MQGSTYQNVIVDLKDIHRNKKEYAQMLYTAITRASEKVIFYYNVDKKDDE